MKISLNIQFLKKKYTKIKKLSEKMNKLVYFNNWKIYKEAADWSVTKLKKVKKIQIK